MLLFGHIRLLLWHIWICVSILLIILLMLPTVIFLVHTILYIFRNRVILLFILWIIWLYSTIIKTFKCVVRISCWSKYELLLVLMSLYTFRMFLILHLFQKFLQLLHLAWQTHLCMSTSIGIFYGKRKEITNWFHTRNIWCHLLQLWIQIFD